MNIKYLKFVPKDNQKVKMVTVRIGHQNVRMSDDALTRQIRGFAVVETQLL